MSVRAQVLGQEIRVIDDRNGHEVVEQEQLRLGSVPPRDLA